MDATTLGSRFSQPSAAYRPMLFWMWNGDITREGIAAQIADFADKGAGGFFFHPMAENFRLKDFLRGMSPPYLSDEYFALVRYAVECARDHGLYAWLYDEGGWPSGTAQGKVVEGHPEFAGRRLHVTRLHDGATLPQNVIAAAGLPEMGIPVPLDMREVAQGLWPYSDILVFHLVPDGYPVDILNPAAVRRFIEVTHERYAETVGEFFGNTVPGIFTDETSLGGRAAAGAVPWTRDLLEQLTGQMDRDARAYLPLLFSPEAVGPDVIGRYSEHELIATRCEYYDVLTRRFGEAYWQQITDWCTAHGLLHTGHVGGEDNLPDHLSFGHFFRTAGALHAPGVDTIWRQLFPGQTNFPFPRLATSALKQRPRQPDADWSNLTLTESNAVYGFGLQYEQMRWLTDYQFQGGISLFAPMATHYSTESGRLYCTMSHVGPGNPLWPAYGAFAEYVGRMSVITRHTEEQAPVAVYYPVEALWTGDGTAEAWASLREACLTLTEQQVGFDFLDGDFVMRLRPDDLRAVADGLAYRLIIVPAMLAISAPALTKLASLAASGVPVIFLGHWPLQPMQMNGLSVFDDTLRALQTVGVNVVEPGELATHLAGLRLQDDWLWLADPDPDLLMSVRRCEDARLYFLTNNSPRVMEPFLTIRSPEDLLLEAWDARDGERVELTASGPNSPVEFRPILPPWSSLILSLRPCAIEETGAAIGEETVRERAFSLWLADPESRETPVPHADVLVECRQADAVRIVDEYAIRGGDVEIMVEATPRHPYVDGPAELLLWEEWGMPEFSGHVEYTFDLTIAEHFAVMPLLLDLGPVYWTASVWLNDEHLGDSLWAPHTLDITGKVRSGVNRLRVIVGNTLANQACQPEVIEEAREHGWCNTYFERSIPMMSEDLRSGLLGPVRVIVAQLPVD